MPLKLPLILKRYRSAQLLVMAAVFQGYVALKGPAPVKLLFCRQAADPEILVLLRVRFVSRASGIAGQTVLELRVRTAEGLLIAGPESQAVSALLKTGELQAHRACRIGIVGLSGTGKAGKTA